MWQKCDKIKLINYKIDWYKLITDASLVGNSLHRKNEKMLKYQCFLVFLAYMDVLDFFGIKVPKIFSITAVIKVFAKYADVNNN